MSQASVRSLNGTAQPGLRALIASLPAPTSRNELAATAIGHAGPALAGRGAEASDTRSLPQIVALPERLRRSLTRDRGHDMETLHAQPRPD